MHGCLSSTLPSSSNVGHPCFEQLLSKFSGKVKSFNCSLPTERWQIRVLNGRSINVAKKEGENFVRPDFARLEHSTKYEVFLHIYFKRNQLLSGAVTDNPRLLPNSSSYLPRAFTLRRSFFRRPAFLRNTILEPTFTGRGRLRSPRALKHIEKYLVCLVILSS